MWSNNPFLSLLFYTSFFNNPVSCKDRRFKELSTGVAKINDSNITPKKCPLGSRINLFYKVGFCCNSLYWYFFSLFKKDFFLAPNSRLFSLKVSHRIMLISMIEFILLWCITSEGCCFFILIFLMRISLEKSFENSWKYVILEAVRTQYRILRQ